MVATAPINIVIFSMSTTIRVVVSDVINIVHIDYFRLEKVSRLWNGQFMDKSTDFDLKKSLC
jgi:hypothetical protein